VSIIKHPTDENLRIRTERDEGPAKPYHDGGFPIWRMDYSRHDVGYVATQETDLTSYVTADHLDRAIGKLFHADRIRRYGYDDNVTLARYLRIYWGVTFVKEWHSGNYWYVTADPADWREKVGVTDEATKLTEYAADPFDEFEAWVNGDVHIATEQKRMWQRTTTRTWDPAQAEDPTDPESSDETNEDTTDGYVWDDTLLLAGFYGDVDQAMAATMAWNFGWDIPEGHTFEIEED
jgi:hypothetical protein